MKLFPVIALLFLQACATATRYQPADKNGGYMDGQEGPYLLAGFYGNAHTSSEDAYLFSQFRAIEVCRYRNETAFLYGVENQSTSRSIQKTSSYNYTTPTNFSGTMDTTTNNYGLSNTNFSGQFSGGNSFGDSTTWVETYNYPSFVAIYQCSKKHPLIGVRTSYIPNEKISKLSKDTLGALLVVEVNNESPNSSKFRKGDILLEINDKRLTSLHDLRMAVLENISGKATASVIRKGKIIELKNLKYMNGTPLLEKLADEIIQNSCNRKNKPDSTLCK